jgi:hypothetical protein
MAADQKRSHTALHVVKSNRSDSVYLNNTSPINHIARTGWVRVNGNVEFLFVPSPGDQGNLIHT